MVRPTPPQTSQADWEAVRRKLAEAGEQLHGPPRYTPEEAARILAERARELAAVPDAGDDSADAFDAVRFELGNNHLLLGLDFLQEVAVRITPLPVPHSPRLLLGLMNLRGNILPVFDLQELLKLNPGEATLHAGSVLICGTEQPEFGLLVQRVEEVETVSRKLLREPPQSLSAVTRNFLLGVTPRMTLVIDGELLLTDSRLFIEQEETP